MEEMKERETGWREALMRARSLRRRRRRGAFSSLWCGGPVRDLIDEDTLGPLEV